LSFSIAVAGKGGSGKTTIAALAVRYLKNRDLVPILAIDADPNANLGESLGLEIGQTMGTVLASFQGDKISIPPGMTKEAYLDIKLNGVIIESKGLDIITMGRGEGPECYCYPNLILRKFVDSLAGNYRYVVMDNEAGMEHLSRRTTQNIDVLLMVSNHSVKGVRAVARISELIEELKLVVKKQCVVINAAPLELAPTVRDELNRLGVEPLAFIPEDKQVYQYDLEMKPLLGLPDTSEAVMAVNGMMSQIMG